MGIWGREIEEVEFKTICFHCFDRTVENGLMDGVDEVNSNFRTVRIQRERDSSGFLPFLFCRVQ